MELISTLHLEQPYIRQYEELLEESNKEDFFYGEGLNHMKERVVVITDDMVVGFFEPGTTQFEGKSYFRTNRPYTRKSVRGNHLMRDALIQWYKGRCPGLAWIDDQNVSSIRLFQAIGFVKSKPFFHKKRDGHFYLLG